MSNSDYPEIVFIVRLFSAFEQSLLSGRWNPRGMPTVGKLWEQLSKNEFPFKVYCTAATNSFEKDQSIHITGIRADFIVSAPLFYTRTGISGSIIHRINSVWMKAKAFFNILSDKGERVFYVDRENVIVGAILSLTGKKVILRLHGVAGLFRRYNSRKGTIKSPLRRWAFKAPFSMIIATEDGSPVREFIDRFTNKKVPSNILINGIHPEPDEVIDIHKKHVINNDFPVVLFVSRLVKGKGIEDFFETIFRLLDDQHKLNVLIVGEGELKTIYQEKSTPYPSINFAGAVPHNIIMNYYIQSDIFVSLNRLGDLPNTVLEAISGECCMLVLLTDNNSHHDTELSKIIRDNVVSISGENTRAELHQQLMILLNSKSELEKKKKNAQILKKTILNSWEERMNQEINLISTI